MAGNYGKGSWLLSLPCSRRLWGRDPGGGGGGGERVA